MWSSQFRKNRQGNRKNVHFLFVCYKFLVSCGSFPTKLSGSQVSHSCKWWVGWAYREVKTYKKDKENWRSRDKKCNKVAPSLSSFLGGQVSKNNSFLFSFGFLINLIYSLNFILNLFFTYLVFVPSSLLLCFLFVWIL